MAETPSAENPTTSSTVSQRFLSADQILAPPQDTRKIKNTGSMVHECLGVVSGRLWTYQPRIACRHVQSHL